MPIPLRAPFPWFGGKSSAADLIWQALGDVPHYIEPFAGALGALLGRPHPPRVETVNDKDAYICNVWRALEADPDTVARWADYPVNESDLHARHVWLRRREGILRERVEGDPFYYDAQIAGWWLWGISAWIGGGWCDADTVGPWAVSMDDDGYPVLRREDAGKGVNRKRPHLSRPGMGVSSIDRPDLVSYFRDLQTRLRGIRVNCGDWRRILGPAVLQGSGMAGVLLDPPYSHELRDAGLYAQEGANIAADVREWAIAHGDDPMLRIVLCGYEGEHDMPETWRCVAWKAKGGYGSLGKGRGRENAHKERLWLSPHCLQPAQQQAFTFA